jgi:hypothetical protein
MSAPIATTFLAGIVAVAAIGCSSDGGPSGNSAKVLQIAGVAANPQSVSCFGGGTRQILFNVHIVNTTGQSAAVTSFSSTGLTVAASDESDLGKSTYTFSSLPFTPEEAVVRARDGDVTLTVTMNTACYPLSGPAAANSYVDIYVTLRVTTTLGQLAAAPVTIRQTYAGAALSADGPGDIHGPLPLTPSRV